MGRIYSKINSWLCIIIPNLKLHEMIEMHSKYDNMHTNGMFYALICINNHVFAC